MSVPGSAPRNSTSTVQRSSEPTESSRSERDDHRFWRDRGAIATIIAAFVSGFFSFAIALSVSPPSVQESIVGGVVAKLQEQIQELSERLPILQREIGVLSEKNRSLEESKSDLESTLRNIEAEHARVINEKDATIEALLKKLRPSAIGRDEHATDSTPVPVRPNSEPEPPSEPMSDDSQQGAIPFGLNRSKSGDIGGADAEDWYRVEVSQPGLLSYRVTNTLAKGVAQGTLGAVALFSENGKKIAAAGGLYPGTSRESKPISVGAGRYYLQVNDSTNSVATYRIDLRFSPR